MGRRKIEMKMVVDSGCRQVTFSKRRTGLFKKANELATLCGAEVAVVVFSPGGKPFSFGQPTVEAVANRFLAGDDAPPMKKVSKRDAAAVEKLNDTLNEKTRQLHEEKAIGEAIDKEIKGWKSFDFDSMEFFDLVRLRNSLEGLRVTAEECVSEVEASSTLLMLSNDDFFKSQP